jgi:hypothetical protein
MEKFGHFKFRIYTKEKLKGWHYSILNEQEIVLCDSKEAYELEGIARFAAIGHITLLEQGKEV